MGLLAISEVAKMASRWYNISYFSSDAFGAVLQGKYKHSRIYATRPGHLKFFMNERRSGGVLSSLKASLSTGRPGSPRQASSRGLYRKGLFDGNIGT
jgi:hypothetical protein